MAEVVYKGRLNGIQRNRMKSLFDMMYSTRELADELGIDIHQIYYVYVPLGCPHEREPKNHHIFINGKAFAEWYSKVYVKIKIGPDETFCRTCRKAVKLHKSQERVKGTLTYVLSVCPSCGRNLTKILSDSRRDR